MGLLTRVAVGAAVTALGVTMSAVPAAASSLTVSGYCEADFGFGATRDFECSASASGGTGSYSYSWRSLTPNAVFLLSQGPLGDGYCWAYTDNVVRVTVTSSGETASADVRFHCPSSRH
ncbi:hypothetical protein JD81_02391 [Micromonospora sagamiensis]|uniref:Ig-like domain-containing protein n=1 Tax=Micromonospora sagamiensis TaxID=47875 RepID=A0A562WFH5_9ACTN|nr:hypothetical protein JD81_02391 [Micromonospora sagamiensis]